MATRKKATRAANEELEIKDKNVQDQTETDNTEGVVNNDEIVDVPLTALRKKRFRIDGDDNRILYLDTSDFSIISRLQEAFPKLHELLAEAFAEKAKEEDDGKANQKLLDKIDKQMRELLDYVFDTNASEICAPTGKMFDIFNGELRFEHILEALTKLCADNIEREYRNMNRRLSKYTAKYTNKKGK